MFCDKCGNKNLKSDKFCTRCGHLLDVDNNLLNLRSTQENTRLVRGLSVLPLLKRISFESFVAVAVLTLIIVGYFSYKSLLRNQEYTIALTQQQVEKITKEAGINTQIANEKFAKVQSDLVAAKRQSQILKEERNQASVQVNLSNSQVISKVKPAVVYIETKNATGSGMIISSDGYVLTNAHVVNGNYFGTVTLSSGVSYSASVVGRNENIDIAILKISATDLPTVSLGSSDGVGQGDDIFALGFPFGIKGDVSFTSGVISRRIIDGGDSYFETTASIHPGNSGGPLVNRNGQVVGINTAIYGASVGGINVGETIKLAIPINIVKPEMSSLKNGVSIIKPTTTSYVPYVPPPVVVYTAPTVPTESSSIIGRNYFMAHHTCVGLSGEQYSECISYAINH